MTNYTKNEKCAIILALTHIGAIQDDRKYARTSVMLRFQDMLGIDNFELIEYSNTKSSECFPTLKAMSNEKKKHFVMMMLGLIYEDGKVVDSETKALTTLCMACDIPIDLVKEVMTEFSK